MDIKSLLKTIKLHESTISMILGAIIIVLVGILLINFFSRRQGTSLPPLEEISDEITLPTTHIVIAGEDLWKISEIYYGSGYNWTDISEASNLSNSEVIETGQELIIPEVSPKLAQQNASDSLTPTPSPIPQITESAAEDSREDIHIVSRNEDLWSIAERYYNSGFSWVEIAKANDLTDPNTIIVGQELKIPGKNVASSPSEEQVAGSAISGATYEVQKSDTLWSIAVRAYGDGYKWVEIAKENNLSNANLIHPGNNLRLPR